MPLRHGFAPGLVPGLKFFGPHIPHELEKHRLFLERETWHFSHTPLASWSERETPGQKLNEWEVLWDNHNNLSFIISGSMKQSTECTIIDDAKSHTAHILFL